MLTLFNTLTMRQEEFRPIDPKRVRMYVCGVTVYDYCHIGHARSALVFDMLRRYLEYSGYEVTFVKNFTDVDDKIIKRANEHGVPSDAITAKYIQAYYEDMGKLGIRPASVEPKATEHILDIIRLTETLVEKGLAYRVDGDVYFEVAKYAGYGRLSKRKLGDMQAGARVDVDERKRHPMDFALWKSSKPGEPSWDSPWGPGRPGWHIECSAMSMKHLGETFDIHGGGMDLIFPHHENEIAQSCGATGKEFAHYWVHNGFVQINQNKMSKSLGNFFTIREIFTKQTQQWPEAVVGEMLRYFLLSTHYRGPLDFSDQALQEAKSALDGFYDLFKRLEEGQQSTIQDEEARAIIDRARLAYRQKLDDDLNSPMALAVLQNLKSTINKLLERWPSIETRKVTRAAFKEFGAVFGLFQLEPHQWQFKPASVAAQDVISVSEHVSVGTRDEAGVEKIPKLSDAEIESKIAERLQAKGKKDFAKADEIRKSLAAQGIIVEDRPDGTSRWKR
ncbi:MAG: cysS [Nitrospira sp.]|jgi:cysteinyl-tRNA synthetase|nr:cysS [Nitrospira sp.]